MHHLGGSPGAVFLGTITMGLTQGDTLHTITPAFSSISISSCTHCTCFRAKVYGFWLTGGLSPVRMSILRRGVFPKSDESFDKISVNSSHSFLKDSFFWGHLCILKGLWLPWIYICRRFQESHGGTLKWFFFRFCLWFSTSIYPVTL